MQSIDPGDSASFDTSTGASVSGGGGVISPGGYLKRPRSRSRGTSMSSDGSSRSGASSNNHHSNNNNNNNANNSTNNVRDNNRGGSLHTSFSAQGSGPGPGQGFSEVDDSSEERWRGNS